ncbi:hypothetical protein PPL_07461 [Heterostelium album PN500]|uniref:Uncharacterized protein n=1 Tax=Heterostelium pallidum (strain ATCC 26659 / Pp 5 / PN500) TaxID=670386 RepID=D3BG10_HETP5|nr:hypothetical protein PPL_07461 [Heterostelium album PN500]EFA79602.1 hypothetical protein PPL_07461 [Heterostelium album PN500]|eukprot:XP_020431723.1 hypothetical protein PPL_07461 [Heterostelium album PN500]
MNTLLKKRTYQEVITIKDSDDEHPIIVELSDSDSSESESISEIEDDFSFVNLEGIDFKDLNSLINLNRIYNLYYQCLESGNDSLRSQCVKFFVDYHKCKFIHYFDVQGYIKFIVDVFFDPKFNVFNNMSSFFTDSHLPTIEDIYNRIINDKRKLNEVDHQLTKRIEIYQECFYFGDLDRIQGTFKYHFNDFYNKQLAKNNDNEKQEPNNQNCEFRLKKNTNTGSDSIFINKESSCFLSDLLLDRIISFSLINKDKSDYILVEYVMNFSLVSKKFFRVVSKILTKSYYESHGLINLESEYSLIQSPPLFFDYESIKYIKYGWSTDRINQLFERVELFLIKSDEYDYTCTADPIQRDYITKHSFGNLPEEYYQESITTDGYLVHLPAMPNLKSITVKRYYGFEDNYSSFLTSIFKSTPNGDGHGIESFKIDIYKDTQEFSGDFCILDFLSPLLRLHSKTLKSIEFKYIKNCGVQDMKELLKILKDWIPTMEQHNYSFKLYTNYQKLDRACRDDLDRKVQQYFLNQKVKNNISDEDIGIFDDADDYDEDDDSYE